VNELQIFNSEEFGEIRTVTIDNEPWFVGKDVAIALGYTNPQKAVRDHVQEDDRGMNEMDTPSGRQTLTVINESGLYALIFGSKLESAKRFKHWVTSEVLPAIRKNGGYIAGQESLSDDELLAKALMVAQNKIAERDKLIAQKQKRIDEMRPKEIFADAVTCSNTSILVGDLAKLLKQNGFHVGQNRLFEILRSEGFLIKGGSSKNMPTQKSMEMKLFEIKESTVTNPDGSIRTTKTPKVTGRGQVYFINKFVKKKGFFH
jgi:anti-repressor protein